MSDQTPMQDTGKTSGEQTVAGAEPRVALNPVPLAATDTAAVEPVSTEPGASSGPLDRLRQATGRGTGLSSLPGSPLLGPPGGGGRGAFGARPVPPGRGAGLRGLSAAPAVTGRGAPIRDDRPVLEQMQALKGTALLKMQRVCEQDEAVNTVKTMRLGGREPDGALRALSPSEEEAVEQVANNEGVRNTQSMNVREAQLQAILAGKAGAGGAGPASGSSSSSAPPPKINRPKPKNVKEFSPEATIGLPGAVIEFQICARFCVKGSNLSNENGYIAYVGAPLASARILRNEGETTPGGGAGGTPPVAKEKLSEVDEDDSDGD